MLISAPLVAGSLALALAAPVSTGAATPAPADSSWKVVAQTPISNMGQSFGLDPAGGDLYIPYFAPRHGLHPAISGIAVVDPATGKLIAKVRTPGELAPGNGSLAVDTQGGKVYVPNFGSSSVSVISGTKSLGPVATQAKSMPWGAVYDPANNDVYVTDGNDNSWLGSGEVYVIDASTDRVVSSFATDDDAADPAVDPTLGKLFVTVEQGASGSGVVDVYNTATGASEGQIPVGPNARRIEVDPELHRAFVLTDDGIDTIDTQTDAVVGTTVPTGQQVATDMALNPVTHDVFVASGTDIYEIDGATGRLISDSAVPGANALGGIAVDPATNTVSVGDTPAGASATPQLLTLVPSN